MVCLKDSKGTTA